jgi:hypothetical protein
LPAASSSITVTSTHALLSNTIICESPSLRFGAIFKTIRQTARKREKKATGKQLVKDLRNRHVRSAAALQPQRGLGDFRA